MKQRLEQFLAAENLTKAQFADSINMARAGISHIMAGRNNPSYEFIINTMEAYPDLNIEWLLRGNGRMYKAQDSPTTQIHDMPEEDGMLPFYNTSSVESLQEKADIDDVAVQSGTPLSFKSTGMCRRNNNQNKGKRVIILYDDGTYEEFC